MATIQIYATGDADINSIYKGGSGSWATEHDATAGTGLRGAGENYVNAKLVSGQYWLERSFWRMATSAIPDDAVISACLLRLMVRKENTRQYARVLNSNHSDTIVTGDYDTFGSDTWSDDLQADNNTSYHWKYFTFNATGIAGLNLSGNTKFALREVNYDIANSAPSTGQQEFIYRNAGYAGTEYDPYLDITYTEPSPAGRSFGVII